MNTHRPKGPLLARLAGEFFVIVVGVLVALWVDEFVTARAEAERTAAYLEQIQVELIALAGDLSTEIDGFEGARDGAARLIEGMSATPIASSDSLDAWFVGLLQLGPFQPEMVTLNTMVATGELLLIRDQSLRAALMRFQNGPARLAVYQRLNDQLIFDGFRVVSELADMNVMAPLAFGTRSVSEQWNWAKLSDDVAFRSAIYSMANGTRNHLLTLLEFSEEVAQVQEALARFESTSR